MATTYTVPLGPRPRSITGVAVTPISGDTWLHPRVSEVCSPDLSIDVFQIVAPVSAFSAYTESCSVGTIKTLKVPLPETTSCDTYKGCASTRPSSVYKP